jgi:hypothetical protein
MKHQVPKSKDVQQNCYGNLNLANRDLKTLNLSHNQEEGDIFA